MKDDHKNNEPHFGAVKSVDQLGMLIREFRKQQHFTLERVSGLVNVSMRFLSELERGKKTCELGKTLSLLNKLGLDVIVQPRAYNNKKT